MKIFYLTATAEIYLDDTTHRWVALEHERPTGKTWPEAKLDEARRWLHTGPATPGSIQCMLFPRRQQSALTLGRTVNYHSP